MMKFTISKRFMGGGVGKSGNEKLYQMQIYTFFKYLGKIGKLVYLFKIVKNGEYYV